MEANLKAKLLIYQFHKYSSDNIPNFLDYQPDIAIKIAKYSAIQCAIICVNEILNARRSHFGDSYVTYWEEVKKELLAI
jgi:hypothetical protein